MSQLRLIYTCPDTGYSVHQEDCFVTDHSGQTVNHYDWVLCDNNNCTVAIEFEPKTLTGPAGWLKKIAKARANATGKTLIRLNIKLKVAQDIHDKWDTVYSKIK